jgi:nucleotide-binding universal stress UspA family protein
MLVSISRILFPTDFSEPARQAQQYAMALAERFGAELHFLHVVPEVTMGLPDSSTYWTLPDADLKAQVESANERILNDIGHDWAAQHHPFRTSVVGNVIAEIQNYSARHNIDLIVVGTHGYTGMSHLLLGSIAEKLVRISTCPVLTVHPKGHQFVSDNRVL